MIESRCGLLCQACAHRPATNCPGCVAMDKPFWGESCPIKSCCESRTLSHCGLCADFPCEQLTAFAHDPQQGDDGKRIEQCRRWSQEKPEVTAHGVES